MQRFILMMPDRAIRIQERLSLSMAARRVQNYNEPIDCLRLLNP